MHDQILLVYDTVYIHGGYGTISEAIIQQRY